MARTFTQLKKSMSTEDWNRFCRRIALEYADSSAIFSVKYFCKEYDLTKSCYEKIKEYAIVNNLVSDGIVDMMMEKSIKNQQAHCKTAGITTIEKFARLSNIRTENLQIEIATAFANNPDISKEEFAKRYGLTKIQFDQKLVRAIEDNLVSDEIVDAIESRSIKNAKPGTEENVKVFFEGLRKKREANKKGVALN